MKRIIIGFAALIMIIITIVSATATGGNGAGGGTGNVVKTNTDNELINQASNTQIREEIRTRLELNSGMTNEEAMTQVKGLENAIVRVSNPTAKTHLVANLEKWQNRYQYRYEKQTVIEGENGETLIQAERSIRVLFFKFKAKDSYQIDSEGRIISQYRNWLSNLIPPEEEEVVVE